MKNDKIIDIVINSIVSENNVDLELLSKIIEKRILQRNSSKKLYNKIYSIIKEKEVIIEYPQDSIEKKDILSIMNNPNIYRFSQNKNLIGGIKIKENWNIFNSSVSNNLEKIKSLKLK